MSIPQRIDGLSERLDAVMTRDRHRFSKQIGQLRRPGRREAVASERLDVLSAAIERSVQLRAQRTRSLPSPHYDTALPVVRMKAEIAGLIEAHQVVIVCGETGSGKTTQLPKICLELGRGAEAMIGHTQPRRIAARSVAKRLAEELQPSPVGLVGHKVRFTDQVKETTLVKLMTDGILLSETQGDRFLEQYDTLIIDEAHERSLNIDFLLGYLKRLLPKRPDLKLIITSATIDPASFSSHFGNAPVIEVSGRSYPVEVRYRPLQLDEEQERELSDGVVEAVDELSRLASGDVLVFLPGEREIRDCAEALRKHHPPHTEILPLFARLSASDQDRVFKPHGGRRIVLATNIAETSLTVPGIRFVVDSGLARISRYSYRTKVQRLPVEPISRASAEQRKGRCGRLGPGVCIRLYGEEDFFGRHEFTAPEILRTNLAGVILRMAAYKLGDADTFPFIDAPDSRFINDGYRLLFELQAMDEKRRLTDIGRKLARLPLDPRIARMVLAGAAEGCLADTLIVAAALSIQDPRERPMDARQKADSSHEDFQDPRSDFVSLLKLWQFYQTNKRHLSHRKLRQLCRERYLSLRRLREWEDIHSQLRGLASELGLAADNEPAQYEFLHRALLTGLLSQVACKDSDSEFIGARGVKLRIHPGSGLHSKSPKWIMAAELVETTRLYARLVAEVQPEWIESVGGHVLKRSYYDPHWEKRAGRVIVYERATLFGLLVNPKKRRNYAQIDPLDARRIFIREALARFGLSTRAQFQAHNWALIDELQALEHKSRRPDIVVDEDVLCDFFGERLGDEVVDARSFERWRRNAEKVHPRLLYLSREDLMLRSAQDVTAQLYPDALSVGGIQLGLSYHFEPGSTQDGVTVNVPLAALNQIDASVFEWLVPGMLQEKITALIRALPKNQRRNFVPVPEFAAACARALTGEDGDFNARLSAVLMRMTGVDIGTDQWAIDQLPQHLRMNIRVTQADGKVVAEGRDFAALRESLGERATARFQSLPTQRWERAGLVDWSFGDLPDSVRIEHDGLDIQAYPTLMDERESVRLCVVDSLQLAAAELRKGVLRLYLLQSADKVKYLRKHIPNLQQMCLHYAPLGDCHALTTDIITAAAWQAFRLEHELPRTRAEFTGILNQGRDELIGAANDVAGMVVQTLAEYHGLARQLRGNVAPQWLAALSEIKEHVGRLVYSGFVADTPLQWLAHLPRYFAATERRLEKLNANPARDRALAAEYRPLWEQFWSDPRAEGRPRPVEFEEYRWLLEELWVSLFAQDLKTQQSVSVKRLSQRWRDIAGIR